MNTPAPLPPPAPDAPHGLPPAPGANGWGSLWTHAEARLLVVGLVMTLAVAVAVAVGLVLAPALTLKYATVLGLNMVVGPPAGMSFGYASGLGHAEVVLSTFFAESAQMLVIYPLFVLGWRELVDTRRFAPFMQRLQRAAESGERRVQRYGAIGVFLFVFLPLWMTGPVVGAIIGFLIGLSAAANVSIVLTATALSLLMYAGFIEQIDAWTAAVHPYMLFAVIVSAGVLAWWVRRRWRRAGVPGGDKA